MTSDIGTSSLQTAALLYLNQIHNTVITGGNELEVDIDESWIWARAKRPIILNLNPPLVSGSSGSVTLTTGSNVGTFSTVPQPYAGTNASVEGWYLKPDGAPEIYRIIQHTNGATTFSLDAAFPQANYASTFNCFQLEYDLVTSYIIVDTGNDTLDFISSGTTVQSATITHGSYTPATFATTVAAALTAQDTNTNTYTGSYDTVQRLFTFSSALNGSNTPIFKIVGNGTNYYRSGWAECGFDYLTQSGSASYTGLYALSAAAKLTQPARVYYGYQFGYGSESGQVCNIDPVRFERDYPLIDLRVGTPQYFCVTGEHSPDGKLSIRFNKYPTQQMRVEFEHIPLPKDLQNNAQSIPKIPRKFVRLLEFGASYYLLIDKEDSKADSYLNLAKQMLTGMMKFNRTELEKTSRNFGSVIARPELVPGKSTTGRVNIYGYDADQY